MIHDFREDFSRGVFVARCKRCDFGVIKREGQPIEFYDGPVKVERLLECEPPMDRGEAKP